MKTLHLSPLLHLALLIDAVASAASGVAMLLFATELEALLALPSALMSGAGAFMLGYAAVIVWLARRDSLPGWAVWTVIIGNALWALDCALLAFVGILAPSTLGVVFLLVQAVIVLGFAELQYVGLKRSTAVL